MSEQEVLPETGQLLFTLAPRLTRLENAVLKELSEPLTFRQYRLLLRVDQGSSTLGELRAPSTLSLAAVSESVDGLVQRRLLARSVDRADRRAVNIAITGRGRRALAEATAALSSLATDLVEGLEVSDAQQMHEVLGQVIERITDRVRGRLGG